MGKMGIMGNMGLMGSEIQKFSSEQKFFISELFARFSGVKNHDSEQHEKTDE